MHTSAKARTSYQCHDTDPDPYVAIRIRIRIRIWIGDPDCHENLVFCSLDRCQPSLKISYKSVRKLLRKVANRQTNRQTNNDDCTSSLAELTVTAFTLCAYRRVSAPLRTAFDVNGPLDWWNKIGWCYGHDCRACILRTRPVVSVTTSNKITLPPLRF